MSTSVEHKLAMHDLARSRIAAGQPVWVSTIRIGDVWKNETLTFTERRDAIVARIKATLWYRNADEFSQLHEIVENLAEAADGDEWDGWWDDFYDEADYARVWIDRTR